MGIFPAEERQTSRRLDPAREQDVESLRELRQLAGKAQADVAIALNIKQPSVSKIEKQGFHRRLVIDIDDTGYKFDVEIAGSPSEGISKMKIFCYDLMLISFARQRGLGIDFLIHDSTIFDGVDPRQRAHALELASTAPRISARRRSYACAC